MAHWCTEPARRLVALLLVLLCVASDATAAESCSGWIADDAARAARLLALADERLGVMEAVARDKYLRGAPIQDAARERAVLAAMASAAQARGLEAGSVDAFFRLQIELARARQQQWFERFASAPPATGEAGALAAARAHIDRINAGLVEALYLAAPLADSAMLPDALRAAAAGLQSTELRDPAVQSRLAESLRALRRGAQPPLARIGSSGMLVIGIAGDYPPFAWLDAQGCLQGIDIARMQALAADLGVAPVFVRTRWDALADDLATGRFDIAAGGVTITPARAARGAFSAPLHRGGKTAISRCDALARFDTWAEIDEAHTQLIVNPGGTNEQYVRAHVKHAQIRVFPDNLRIFDEIVAGRADVMITDDVEVALHTAREPALCRALPGLLTQAEKAFYLPVDAALKARVDAWLAQRLRAERESAGGA